MASSTFPQFSVFKFGSRPGAHHLAHHPGLVGLVSSTFWPFCIAYTVTSGNESIRYRTTTAIRAPDAVDFEEPDTAAQSTLHPTPDMPRMTRKSVSREVKEEVVDNDTNEEIDGNSDPQPGLRRGSAAATASAAATRSSPALTSRFFPSPSSCPARVRKRKSADGGCVGGDARGAKSGLGQAPTVKEEPTDEESGSGERGGGGGGRYSRNSRSGSTQAEIKRASPASTGSAGGAGTQRRSSRFDAAKKEELPEEPELPRRLPAAAAALERGGGRGTKPMRMATGRLGVKNETGVKQEGKGKETSTGVKQEGGGRKASKRAKIEAQGEGEPQVKEEKLVPPRLAQKAALIAQVMDRLYPNPPIPINHLDSFTLLCGVLLSAQTTDAQVNLVTKELFRVAPNPQALSKMAHEDLQQIIRSVGLAPTKAKHLIALSQQLLDRFDGQVPQTFEGLQSLPGVGRKTAAVVMVQAFNTPAFPVDTHIHRLALRWGLTKNEKNASKVEQELMALFPRESWAKLHLQFIYFGREHCQTGPSAPKALSELSCLRDYLASPTPPKKSSKNAIIYSERMLEMEQFRMKLEDK